MYGNYAHFYDWNNSDGWNVTNGGQPANLASSKLPCVQNKSGAAYAKFCIHVVLIPWLDA